MQERFTRGARRLAIVAPDALAGVEPEVSGPFAAMLPAIEDSDAVRAPSLASELVRMGCAEICCVGPHGEAVHDLVDEVVEDLDALSVVTTWHADMNEGCEYFISTAGARPSLLVAIVAGRDDLANLIRSMFRTT